MLRPLALALVLLIGGCGPRYKYDRVCVRDLKRCNSVAFKWCWSLSLLDDKVSCWNVEGNNCLEQFNVCRKATHDRYWPEDKG